MREAVTIGLNGVCHGEANETFDLDRFGNGRHSRPAEGRGIGAILNDDST